MPTLLILLRCPVASLRRIRPRPASLPRHLVWLCLLRLTPVASIVRLATSHSTHHLVVLQHLIDHPLLLESSLVVEVRQRIEARCRRYLWQIVGVGYGHSAA